MMYLSCTMIAEIVGELGQSFRQVILAAPINDIEPLVGVGVIKAKPVFARGGRSRGF
jgi:hypothetical protein